MKTKQMSDSTNAFKKSIQRYTGLESEPYKLAGGRVNILGHIGLLGLRSS